MAVKDLINCGVHEGRGGGGVERRAVEKRVREGKKPKVKKQQENQRVMRKKVVASVCYGGSSALVFTA